MSFKKRVFTSIGILSWKDKIQYALLGANLRDSLEENVYLPEERINVQRV